MNRVFKVLFVEDIDPEVLARLSPAFRKLRREMRKKMGLKNRRRPKIIMSPEPKVCAICDNQNFKNRKFCEKCGRPFDQIAAVQLDFIHRHILELAKMIEEEKSISESERGTFEESQLS